MFLNRFRSLFFEDLPTVVWWPSSPEGKVWDQRTTYEGTVLHHRMINILPGIVGRNHHCFEHDNWRHTPQTSPWWLGYSPLWMHRHAPHPQHAPPAWCIPPHCPHCYWQWRCKCQHASAPQLWVSVIHPSQPQWSSHPSPSSHWRARWQWGWGCQQPSLSGWPALPLNTAPHAGNPQWLVVRLCVLMI